MQFSQSDTVIEKMPLLKNLDSTSPTFHEGWCLLRAKSAYLCAFLDTWCTMSVVGLDVMDVCDTVRLPNTQKNE